MKQNKLLALLSLSVMTTPLLADRISDSSRLEATSKTTLTIHPLFLSQSPELVSSARNDKNQTRENGWGGFFQGVLFGSGTTDSDGLARYFFPDAQECLIAANDGPPANPGFIIEKNLLAQDFNVFTINNDFKSKITIAPQQSVIGLGLHVRQSFWKNHDTGRGFWISFSGPIERVKNDMNFCEFVENDGGGVDEAANEVVVANMTQAFRQEAWKYGKICADSSLKRTGLGDIEAKVGYEWLQHEPAHMESYLGLIIPTGNSNNAEYVFEPIIGRGKHWGVMFGSSLGIEIWNSEEGDKKIRFELSNHSEVLFRNKQTRSFDLKNRPWSRYLPVYADAEEAQAASILMPAAHAQNASTPGINVFTKEVKVTPGLTHDANSGFVFSWGKFRAEAGYNFLAKRAEDVELNCPWQPGPALKHYLGAGETNPIRTINGSRYYEQIVTDLPMPIASPLVPGAIIIPVALANYEMSIIQESDIDLNSAATPSIFANTLYGVLGFDCEDREYPLFGNFGASYTFSKNNDASPRRWIIWAKMGVSY